LYWVYVGWKMASQGRYAGASAKMEDGRSATLDLRIP